MTDREYLQVLLKLSEENPKMPIFAMIHQDCKVDYDGMFYISNITHSNVREYWQPDEIVFTDDQIDEELNQIYEDDLSDLDDAAQDIFITEKHSELVGNGEIKKAIFVTIAV